MDGHPHQAAPEPGNTHGAPAFSKRGFDWNRLIVLAVVVSAAGYVFVAYRHQLSLAKLAQHEEQLQTFRRDHSVLVSGAAFIAYVAVTGLSLPLATPLTLACGWFFGFWRGVILVSFASTAGSTLAFLFSRYVFRDAARRRFGARLARFDESLKQEGAFYLFSLRLIPAVPFFMINIVMGLTPLRVWTFWWASQLGMLPGTCVYVWAGSEVPSLGKLSQQGFRPGWPLIAAFVALGLFPLVVKKLLAAFRSAAGKSP